MELDYTLQYAKWHDTSDDHYARSARFYHRLLRPVLDTLPAQARLLDVGCGTGLLVHALKVQGRDVAGIDASAQQVAVAASRGLPCRHVDLEYIHRLSVEAPGSYDAIFLMDVLEHVPPAEHMRFVGALHALLAPAGRLVLSVPNATSTFAARWLYQDWTHHVAFTEHSVEFVVRHQGFAQVRFLPYEYGDPLRFPYLHQPGFWVWLLRRTVRGWRRLEAIGELGRQGLRVPLALNLLAECRKAG